MQSLLLHQFWVHLPKLSQDFHSPRQGVKGVSFFGHFCQNWNNGRFKELLGGDIPFIGEEIILHHVGGKPIRNIKGRKVFEEPAKLACNKTYC